MTGSELPVVEVNDLAIAHEDGEILLEDVSFSLGEGEIILLAGPSGSGKSTLVNLLSGALEGTWDVSGRISFEGEDYDLSEERATVGGVVFQNFALFDNLTVAENLAIASEHNERLDPRFTEAIDQLLVGIDRGRSVNACSGGQRQRVAIARTLLANRPVLFLDEPNSGLDVVASGKLARLVADIASELGTPVVIIAHHFRHFIDLADRALAIDPAARTLVTLPASEAAIEAHLERAAVDRAEEMPGDHVHALPKPALGWWRGELPSASLAWQWTWMLRFFVGYVWQLCFAPSSLLFVALGSVIIGFVTTWFIFMYLPFRDLLMPVIHSDALAGVAFAEIRVMAPLVTAILITTRNASLICSDIGQKVYSDQIKAMRNLNIPHDVYLSANVLLASVVASIVLVAASVCITAWFAMITWSFIFPENSTYMWRDQFLQRLWPPGHFMMVGVDWIAVKAIPSITGAALIALYFGYRPKLTVLDINDAIAKALIWGMSFVLVWQSVLTLIEFKYVSERLEQTF